MPDRRLRARLRSVDDLRLLTDAEADALLRQVKSIEDDVVWTSINKRFVRLDVLVRNPAGENLKLTAKINRLRPGASNWVLLWGSRTAGEHEECLRRLDMRGSHRNPDGEEWRTATHKHRWSSAENNDWAYTPDDIPHEAPGSVVHADNYRDVFEAFAAECGVSLGSGYSWSDPPMDLPPAEEGLWEA